MAHKIYQSIVEMTRPGVLSSLVQQPVTKTCLKPFETAGFSSTESKFLTVDDCRIKRPRYIIKRLRKEQDWVMMATEDHHWRTISIWQHGLLDRLPQGINHGTIACSKDEEGYAALASYPKTLVHNDFRRPNLGIERVNQPQLYLFDWARPIVSVPAIDLIYYLYFSSTERLPISHEQSIETYKQRLATYLGERFDESWWQPQLELGLLGVLSEAGFYTAWFAQHAENAADRKRERATLQWWSEQARRGVKWLDSM